MIMLLQSGCSWLCQTGDDPAAPSNAINPFDYFKAINPQSGYYGCQQCDTGTGFGSPATPKVCTYCEPGASEKNVNGKSQCVCDNGARDHWFGCVDCYPKEYIGKVFDSNSVYAGTGTCEVGCPPSYPVLIFYGDSSGDYNICCKYDAFEGGCGGLVANCWDGTSGKTVCSCRPMILLSES